MQLTWVNAWATPLSPPHPTPPHLLQEWNRLDALLLAWGKIMLKLDAEFHTVVAALTPGGTAAVHRLGTTADDAAAVQQGGPDDGSSGGLGVADLHSHAVRQQVGSESVWTLNTGALEVSHKMRFDLHQLGVCGGESV